MFRASFRVATRSPVRFLSTTTSPTAEQSGATLSRNAQLMQKIRQQQQVKAAKMAKKNDPRMKTISTEWTPRQLRWNLFLWGTAFAGFMTWAVSYGRSVQLKTSPLFKGVMFTLRQDSKVRKWIGNNLEASKHVEGYVNHIKGRADISFEITGSLGNLLLDIGLIKNKHTFRQRECSITGRSPRWRLADTENVCRYSWRENSWNKWGRLRYAK